MIDSMALLASLPASDMERAKAWYADKLGLTPVEEGPLEGAWYESGGVRFLLYASQFAGTNQATSASFTATDFEGAMAHLRDKGVVFEDYDFGEDFRTVEGVLTLPDGNKGAWFKDSEGNILSVSTM